MFTINTVCDMHVYNLPLRLQFKKQKHLFKIGSMQIQLQENHTNRKHPSITLKKLVGFTILDLHIYKLHVIWIAKLLRYLAMSTTTDVLSSLH